MVVILELRVAKPPVRPAKQPENDRNLKAKNAVTATADLALACSFIAKYTGLRNSHYLPGALL
jgi:hypothetical protein